MLLGGLRYGIRFPKKRTHCQEQRYLIVRVDILYPPYVYH